ncbi:response regulator [filamentous cyanobacterium LEGE 11480]|uniref:histidine kinase n=1 Tax=Romeriopsis navalis LEGE 11480 TaxID=2777977 RepID=A0A928VPA4_9CYAN|nr:response regulator [Romeriopsis navalis]MBE9030052.1 response regulator [Romeriopsis navalis LEGE 11480]
MNAPVSDQFLGDILIVDDTPENLQLLSRALLEQTYEVRAVLNGPMALSAIRNDPPDLILLDIKMPGMDGYEVCRQLKADVKTRDIPIIFLSALDDSLDKVKAFRVGGADYVTKPFQTEEVLARVKHQLIIYRLNQQIIEQNAALLRSNQDLEQFAYMVSHDLKQPLQGILGFSNLLKQNYQAALGNDGGRFLGHIDGAVRRMGDLIDDLLAYSQISPQNDGFQAIDCNVILEQVLINCADSIERSGAKITYDTPPIILGDEIQITELFQNLINNAIKFQTSATIPQINLTVEPDREAWHFAMQDNGIGIAPDQLESVFKAFKRLHSQQTYPGTGIGLAICQKVVERHGGRIWVTSQLGVGSVFHFTLPVMP